MSSAYGHKQTQAHCIAEQRQPPSSLTRQAQGRAAPQTLTERVGDLGGLGGLALLALNLQVLGRHNRHRGPAGVAEVGGGLQAMGGVGVETFNM